MKIWPDSTVRVERRDHIGLAVRLQLAPVHCPHPIPGKALPGVIEVITTLNSPSLDMLKCAIGSPMLAGCTVPENGCGDVFRGIHRAFPAAGRNQSEQQRDRHTLCHDRQSLTG